ncbi:hypothetical protein OA90_26475 [Labrenzia sp. OB1]|nr:hypothetical protein OA90_26475 [Labrenzia sp. OB1]
MYRSLNNSSSSGIFKEILKIRRLATNIGGEIDQGTVKRLVGEPAKDILRIDRNDISIPNKEDFENNLFEHISKTQNRQGFQKRISNFFSSRIETQTNKYNKFQQNEFEGQCKQIFRELVTCLQKGEKPIQYWEDRQETPFKTLAAPRYEGPAQPWDREQ